MKRKLKLTHIIQEQEEREEQQLSPEQKKQFMEQIKEYNSFRKALQTEADLIKIAEQLSGLAQMAEKTVLAETDDWFDKVTINRNMKELKKINEEFQQTARDAKSVQERMVSLYEDMGHIMGRYFSINPSDQPAHAHTNQVSEVAPVVVEIGDTFNDDNGRTWEVIKPGKTQSVAKSKGKTKVFNNRVIIKYK